ncbi:MAG: hypothetical protein J7K53_02500 [Bacteroidales bacterium]|nr:hypothetical protein [Bacteroidales bacterium]
MKKILLMGVSIVALAFLLTINITLNSSNRGFQIEIDEQVEAVDNYFMHTVDCSLGGTFKRCEVDFGSCDVHAQTRCVRQD